MSESPYDIVVIGGGPAGYVAAIRAAQLGFRTACIEKRKTFGGTCLNVGCIPSKTLLHSSEHFAFLKNGAKELGIQSEGIFVDFPQMMKRKERVVESLVSGIFGLLKKNCVDTFKGEASFVSSHEVEVAEGEKKERIIGKFFILATGSFSLELPFLKFDENQILSSTGALELKEIPQELLVIGAGVIGVELASVYNRLGSRVTIVEMLDVICPAMDKDVSKSLLKTLKSQGINFFLGAKVKEAKKSGKKVFLKVETKEGEKDLSVDKVLVAIGRGPNTEGLGLDKTGVKKSERGFVIVDDNFCTNDPHIFAIGDIIDGPMLAHRASEEGVAVVELIDGKRAHVNYMAIPNVIYTDPEVAAVGVTEEEAKEEGLQVLVGTFPFRANARARCAGDTEGFVKILGEKETGRVIGVHIIGPNASEMIGEGVLAIEKKATLLDIAKAPHAHPTLTESIKEAALNALGRTIHL